MTIRKAALLAALALSGHVAALPLDDDDTRIAGIKAAAELVPPGPAVAGQFGESLWLAPDGTYVFEIRLIGCSLGRRVGAQRMVITETGRYAVDDGTVALTPDASGGAPGSLLQSGSTDRYLVVESRGHAFLLEQGDADRLAATVDAYAHVDRRYVLSRNGVDIEPDELQLLDAVLERILPAPIAARATAATPITSFAMLDGDLTFDVTIDRGRADGVREGMAFYPDDPRIDASAHVEELRERTSVLRAYAEPFDATDLDAIPAVGTAWSTRSRDADGAPQSRFRIVALEPPRALAHGLEDYDYRLARVAGDASRLVAGQYLRTATPDVVARVVNADRTGARVWLRTPTSETPRVGAELFDRLTVEQVLER